MIMPADPTDQAAKPSLPRPRRQPASACARIQREGWKILHLAFANADDAYLRLALPLSLITREDEKPFVRQLLSSFAAWAADFPASERNHHAWPWGLLQHSLETAVHVAQVLTKGATPGDEDPSGIRSWARAAVAAALLHDCGKVMDMEAKHVSSGRVWNALDEPIGDFVSRMVSGRFRQPFSFGFRKRRGLDGHVKNGRELIPVILPSSWPDDVVLQTLAVYDAFVERHDLHPMKSPAPLPLLAGVIAAADQESSRSAKISIKS